MRLQRAIIARLAADPAVITPLAGGLWDRLPTKANAPAAYDKYSGQLLPCAYVQAGGVGVTGLGTARVGGATLLASGVTRAVTIWLYEYDADRDAIEAAKWAIRANLHDAQVATEHEGAGVVLVWAGDLGDGLRDPDLDAEVDQARFTAALALP